VDTAERFTAVVDALTGEPDVTPPDASGPRRFGSRALKADGAAFAMVVRDALVLKLPATRVATLLAEGSGSPFGKPGQSYREWVALPDGEPATDLPLAREALEFARSARR
jgi:hypothetical protein